jgi:ubiquinone/menaquinone biosynthesis C-methylase UbiE
MQNYFKELFSKNPKEIIENDYYYGTDSEGDEFDETNEDFWLNQNGFKNNWEGKRQGRSENFKICDEISGKIAEDGKPFMEIACGPGMGITPIILQKNPAISCLATDACSMLIKAWRCYINNSDLKDYNISLASFSALDIPIKDNSLDYVTSFIGIGSTRNGENGQIQALKEVLRILKPGGSFVTIEGEFMDLTKVDEVFKLMNKFNYYRNDKSWQISWRDKFISAGFKIESEDRHYLKKFTKDDNDLGEAAEKFNIDIVKKNNLYVLRKS